MKSVRFSRVGVATALAALAILAIPATALARSQVRPTRVLAHPGIEFAPSGSLTASTSPTCTINWTGGAGDHSWMTSGNWSPKRVPTTTDFACISSTTTPTINFSGTGTVLGVSSLGQGLKLNSGVLMLTSTTSASTIHNVNLAGGSLNRSGSLSLTGTGTWSAGSLSGSGKAVVVSGGHFNVTSTATLSVMGTLLNQGTVSVTGPAHLGICNSSLIENAGTFTVADGSTLQACQSPGGNFKNDAAGTLSKPGGTGTATASVPLDNAGVVSAAAGVLQITLGNSGGATDTGTFTASGGGSVNLAGGTRTFAAGSQVTGSGVMLTAGTVAGTLNLTGPLAWTGGSVGSSGSTTTITGTAPLTVRPGVTTPNVHGTLLNQGMIAFSGSGALGICNTSLIENAGTFTMGDGTTIQACQSPGGNFKNDAAGTLSKPAGTGTGTVSVPLDNAGVVSAGAGTLQLTTGNSSGGTDSGTFTASGGGALNLPGGTRTFTSGSKVTGTGVALTGATLVGTLNLSGPLTWTSGNLGASGTTTVIGGTAPLSLNPGANSLNVHGTLLNQGSVTFAGPGNIGICNSSIIENAGTFTLADGSAVVACSSPGGSFKNDAAGALTKVAGTGTAAVSVPMDNAGTVSVGAGTLQLNLGNTVGGSDVGALSSSNGASLLLSGGTRNFAAGSTIGGGGATLNGIGTISGTVQLLAPLVWNAGTVAPPGATTTITGTAPLSINLAGSKLFVYGTLINQGTVSFSSTGHLCLYNGGTIENAGVFNLPPDGSFVETCGAAGGQLINDAGGSIVKAAGSGKTSVVAPLPNSGLLNVRAGTVYVSQLTNFDAGTKTLTGGQYKLQGTLSFAGADIAQLAAKVTLIGTASGITNQSGVDGLSHLAGISAQGFLTLQNGRNLSTPGALSNAGTVSLSSSDTLAVLGSYSQTSTGTFLVRVAGTQPGTTFGQLAASGAVTLDGTLSITTASTFTPSLGQQFVIVEGSSVTGTFATVSGTALGGGLRYQVVYDPADVTLQVVPA